MKVFSNCESVYSEVRFYRLKAGLSQSQLAEIVLVSKNTISAIERCVSLPSLPLAYRLCVALGVDFYQLFPCRFLCVTGDSVPATDLIGLPGSIFV